MTDAQKADLAQEIYDAADDEGTIQAGDMVALAPGCPTMHSCQSMWSVASFHGVEDALVEIVGFDPR